MLKGWARVRQGEGEEAIADIRWGIAAYRATGAELESSYWFALLGEACTTFGAVDEGLAALTEAWTWWRQPARGSAMPSCFG